MWRNSDRRLNLKLAFRRRSEVQYQKSLLVIVDQINQIITGPYDGSQTSAESIAKSLVDYSGVIDGWAEVADRRTLAQVERRERNQWCLVPEEISVGLYDVTSNTPADMVVQDTAYRQIHYMRSLPLEATGHVRKIQERMMKAVVHGGRPDQLYEIIMQSGDVAIGRARMIARTETSRATTALAQARALPVGSEGYWQRIKRAGTRPSHRGIKDKFVCWNNPPTLDGTTGHVGYLSNYDCWPEMQISEFRK